MSDNRTLDEVKADDIDQLNQAHKQSERYEFFDRKQAYSFQGVCVQAALKNLGVLFPLAGVGITRNINTRFVDKQLKDKGIVCEQRRYHDEDDVWRTGLYVYKEDGELAFFISNVKGNNPSPFSINRVQKWAVLTNVQVSGGKRAISLPGMPILGGSKGNRNA